MSYIHIVYDGVYDVVYKVVYDVVYNVVSFPDTIGSLLKGGKERRQTGYA